MIHKKDTEKENTRPDIANINKVNIDTILLNEIGEFGLYQLRIIALGALVAIFIAWSTNQFLFTAARINTRCLVPGCDDPVQIEFTPQWIANAIPNVSGVFDNCNKYARIEVSDDNKDETCPASSFDTNVVVPCEEYLYENTDSVVYEYDLACDEWRRSLIGTIRAVGVLFALPITGYASDRWGRRTCMVINVTWTACIGLLRVLAGTYTGFVISQFFEGFGFGSFSCVDIMSMEIVGTKYRVAAAATISSFFAIGQVILAAIAWILPYWRDMTLVLYAPQLIVLSYIWLMPENYRWFASKGRYEKAEEVLEKAARTNRRQLSETSRNALRKVAEESNSKSVNIQHEPWLITLVFRNKPILIRCIASPIWWISTMCVYYGLMINAVHLAGNQYQNFMLVAAVEIPGYWLAVILMNKIGRRPVLLGGFWICAGCMIGCIFVSEDLHALTLTFYLLGKISISTIMVAIHVYTAELYPTKYRHSLFAFSSMMGRLGQIMAPLTPAFSEKIWTGLPFALFATLAFISGGLVFFTPETLGANLPDTMEEALNIVKNKGGGTSVENSKSLMKF